jgi:hypothetical protein
MKPQRAERAIENGQIVYLGRTMRGSISKSSKAYLAFDLRGQRVGKKYATAAEAMRAVLAGTAGEPR